MWRRYGLTPLRLAFLIGLLLFFAAFLIYPLGHVLVQAFQSDGKFSLTFFGMLFTNPQQWSAVLNSINLALLVTAATTLLAVPIAFVMVRYRFRGKSVLSGLLLVPMVLPPFVGAIGLRQMLSRFGSVNLLLMDMGLISHPIDWLGTGLTGVVVMEVLHLYPIMYLNVAAALANVDPSLEEAARNVGAGGFRLFRRITFPLMLPGYFAGAVIVFIWAFTDLGTPLIFEYREVVPVQIFDMLANLHENPMAFVLVVLLIAMTAVFFYLSKWMVGGRRYEMLARGHVGSSVRQASGPLTAAAWIGIAGLSAVALLPHLSVVLTSVADRWFMTVAPTSYTGEHFAAILEHRFTLPSIRNSLVLSSLSTFVDIGLGVGIAFLLTRTRIPGKNVLDTLAMLPLAIPGLVVAFGYVAAFSDPAFKGTLLDVRANPFPLLVVAYAIRRLPYMVRAAYAGFQQTSVTLEEAAHNVGAGPMRTLKRVTLPLVAANLLAGGILCFAFAMLEVSDSLILATREQFFPITKAIYELVNDPQGPYVASALGVLGMLLLAASLFLAGRFLGKRLGELFRA